MRLLTAFFALLCVAGAFAAAPVEKMLGASVMVVVGDSSGSGVVFKNRSAVFVWTDAHVVEDAVTLKSVFNPKTATYTPKACFKDVVLRQEDVRDGRKVGGSWALARVVRYSVRHDIALLRSHKEGWPSGSTTFEEGDYVPKVGDAIAHVGCQYGERGENSFSTGVVAAVGRLRLGFEPNETEGLIYDQASLTAFPGCSGGGIFSAKSGRCIGLVTEFLGPGRNTPGSLCFTPARRLRAFAKEFHCEWALDPKVAVPATDDGPVYVDDMEPAAPPK
jgi:S1-C subfamily serine protease